MGDAEMTDTNKNGYSRFSDDDSNPQNSDGSLRNNPFRVATVCLGLLCVLLLVGIIVQSAQHQQSEQDHVIKFRAMSNEKVGLQENLQTVRVKKRVLENHREELQSTNRYLTRHNDQMQASNDLLTTEQNTLKESQSQLQASQANLTGEVEKLKATQFQLQTNNNALTKDKELLQKQHDLVIKRKTWLQAALDSVTKERDDLKSKISNTSKAKDELMTSQKDLKKDVAHLEERYAASSAEKGKIASSHQNLTEEKILLLEATEVLKKSIAELEKTYERYVTEQRDLKTKCKTVEQDNEKLKQLNNNVTAERDQLQQEVQRLNATVDENKCSSGWRKFENSCYFTSVIKKTWSLARSFCLARGGDLATIKSQDQMDFINGLYAGDQEVWIGLSNAGVGAQWTWVDGTPLTTTWWAKGQPNNHKGKNQDCVEFWHRSSGKGEWNDESCDIVQNFICKK